MITTRFTFLLTLVLAVLGTPALAAYDKPYIGDQITYRTNYEDTFVHLARDYNLGFVEMRAANPGIDPWLPGKGTKITLPTRHLLPDAPREGIVINIPEMRLYVYPADGGEPESFPIGVGREGLLTPIGTTTVVRKKEGPIWTPTPRMRKEKPELKASYGPGLDNPMGTHALYLGWPTYAIHGTNRPFGIGRRVSSGCIRMYPEGIIQLYNEIPVGTKITTVNQPIKLAWIDDRLYLEAHTELEQAVEMEEYGVVSSPKLSEADLKRIIKAAGAYEDKLRWPAIRTAVKERKGVPIEIARRPGGAPDEVVEDEEDADLSAEAELDPEVEEIKKELTREDGDVSPQVEEDSTDIADIQDAVPVADRKRFNQ